MPDAASLQSCPDNTLESGLVLEGKAHNFDSQGGN